MNLFRLNFDRTVAIDTQVSFYPIDDCPMGVKVQLLTIGGVATYGIINHPKDADSFQGWRPVPAGVAA